MSVQQLQAAGTTQWSMPKPEQPLGPNNSKSSPSRPFRLSHITQLQNKVSVFAGTSSDLAGISKQAAAQPKSSMGLQRQRVTSRHHAPRNKNPRQPARSESPELSGDLCQPAQELPHAAMRMLGLLLAQCWLLATEQQMKFPTCQ